MALFGLDGFFLRGGGIYLREVFCLRLQDLILLLLVITIHPDGSLSVLCILERNFYAKA